MRIVIRPGDTLWRIAHRYGTTTAALLALNPEIENPDLIRAWQTIEIDGRQGIARAFILPLERGRVTWPFLARYGIGAFAGTYHPGVDLHEARGAPVKAIGDGIVRVSRFNEGGYGHYVMIEHRAITNALAEQIGRGEQVDVRSGAVFSLCAHLMQGTRAEENLIVRVGDTIGLESDSGNAWGVHTHFEIKKTDELALQRRLITPERVREYFHDPLAFLRGHRFLPVEAWY